MKIDVSFILEYKVMFFCFFFFKSRELILTLSLFISTLSFLLLAKKYILNTFTTKKQKKSVDIKKSVKINFQKDSFYFVFWFGGLR